MEIVSLLKNDGKVARVQLDDGSIIDNVVILYPYGLFANIKIDDNSLGLLFCQNARDYCYVIPYNISKQPTISTGGVAIGDFENNKTIRIENGKVVINADVIIQGKLETSGETKIEGKNFLSHQHSGVQTGSGSSGGVI